MRIGFDAKRIFFNQTGLGNYSRSLVAGLVSEFSENEYHLYTPGMPHYQQFLHGKPSVHRHLPGPGITRKIPALWRTLELKKELKRDRIKIFHGLSNELPGGIEGSGIRTVLTIHDLIFLHYPEHYSWIDRNIYLQKLRAAVAVADLVLATSEHTRMDILNALKVDPDKVVVHYQDCDPLFGFRHSQLELDRFKERHRLFKPYLVSVGTIEKRKNHLNLVKAFMQLAEPELQLVILGKKSGAYNELAEFIRKNQLESSVIFVSQLTPEEVPLLVQASVGSAYISTYEGFGIPVLEGLKSGVPVLTSTLSSMPEVGGNVAVLADPNQPYEIEKGLRKLLQDNRTSQQRISDYQDHLQRFEVKKLSAQLMKQYQSLIP